MYANRAGSRGGSDFTVTAGALVREQQTIFLLPDPARMQVKAKINESRITLIRDGMPVKINVGAAADELLGRVIKVNKYAEQGNMWGPTVKEYVVLVQILNPTQEIRTGMTAEVRIFVEQIEDAIQLPVHAVYEVKKHHFALVKDGDNWDTREIRIGATNDKYVTVNDGIREHEMVVLDPRNHLDKMKIPEIEEEDDRDKLAQIASEAPKVDPAAARAGNRGSDGPSGGSMPAGAPGASGMNPDTIAAAMLGGMDTNSDGKLSVAEVAENERMRNSFTDYDSNKDGSVDLAEMVEQLKKRFAAGGGGGNGGGGNGGGASRGAPSN